MVDAVRQTQKKYCSRALIAAIIIGLVLIVLGYKPVAKGFILGTIFSAVNFVLIGETLPLRIGKSKRGAFWVSLTSIWFRFFVMAVPLIAAIKYEAFNVFAVIPGLFMVQFVILVDHLFFSGSLKSVRGFKGNLYNG